MYRPIGIAALVMAACLGCGGDSVEGERRRAATQAEMFSCRINTNCRDVDGLTRLADGLWRFRIEGGNCFALDINRFDIGVRENNLALTGVSRVRCNFTP
jgi:hypothetical protein